jgi:alkylation response protein AidB-like acyl-CoA dehydrogenase
MDLNYSPEDRAFRDTTRRWLEANVPKGDLKTLDERKQWHRKLYEAGYVGMLWPKEYGGWGATPMQQAIVQDEMARIGAPPTINGLGIGFIGPTIIVHGTDWQKQRYLKKMLTASSTRSRTRAPTSPVSRRAPRSRATTTSSTARRSGPRAGRSRTGASCSRARTARSPSTRASPASC